MPHGLLNLLLSLQPVGIWLQPTNQGTQPQAPTRHTVTTGLAGRQPLIFTKVKVGERSPFGHFRSDLAAPAPTVGAQRAVARNKQDACCDCNMPHATCHIIISHQQNHQSDMPQRHQESQCSSLQPYAPTTCDACMRCTCNIPTLHKKPHRSLFHFVHGVLQLHTARHHTHALPVAAAAEPTHQPTNRPASQPSQSLGLCSQPTVLGAGTASGSHTYCQ